MNVGKQIFSETELVQRAKNGDISAYALLVKEYSGGILAFINRMVPSNEDAEDISQEVFVKAYRALGRFKGHSSFKTYLYAIAKNECYSFLRKNNPVKISMDEKTNLENSTFFPYPESSVESFAERKDFMEIVKESMKKLSPKYASVIQLFYYKQFSYGEISEILEIPMGTVKTHLFRAVQALRKEVLKRIEGENI